MSEPKRYGIDPKYCSIEEFEDGQYVSYEDYARIKKQYDDLEYCQGHVPYAQHRSAVDKWTELFHKTADNFDKVVAENARLKAEVDALKLGSLLTAVDVLAFINIKAEVERLKAGAVKAGEEISHMERHVIASMRAEIERLRRLAPSEDDRNRGSFNP